MNPPTEYLRARFTELDRLLRGDTTRPEALGGRSLEVSVRGLVLSATLLAMFYGACMGSFALLKETPQGLDDPYGPAQQLLATMLKTPALFFLTLLVTLPSLYVANALIGSRLRLVDMTRLLVASISVNLAVLASLGTIVAFFSLTTNSHPFIVLLNVAAFTVAGSLGMMFLLQTLHRVTAPPAPTAPPAQADQGPAPPGDGPTPDPDDPPTTGDRLSAIDMPRGQVLAGHTRLVFRCWIVLFALVGAQMGWVLRPFIGSPELAFTWFRDRDSNFFAAVLGALGKVLFGE